MVKPAAAPSGKPSCAALQRSVRCFQCLPNLEPADATKDGKQDPSAQKAGKCTATARRTMFFAVALAHANGGADACEVEDLIPISKSGKVTSQWVGGKRRKGVREPLTGSMLMKVPLEARLGQGAYGVVWRARHRDTKEIFAVKNIMSSESSIRRQLAARERAISEQVLTAPHPCIVRLFAVRFFEDNGMTSLVMEFCPGGDMLDVIANCRSEAKRMGVPYEVPEEAHAWIGQVYLGIEHLHRMDILSRDVKPENVVFSSDCVAKLTDFGLGRFVTKAEQSKWSFGFPTGTPGYCAPEILTQQLHDHRADLYSLGASVWVLLTGGLTTTKKVTVPRSRPASANDFQTSADDCQLLERCISAPERNYSRPLPAVARSFLLGLVQREPADRYGHQEIRNHAFMGPLKLPAPDATSSAVEVWLRRSRKGEVGRKQWTA